MSKEYSYSKGVILFSISRKMEILKKENEEIKQEIENLKNSIFLFGEELNKNEYLIGCLDDLKDMIDNDELLPLPPDNKSFDFYKDEIPFPDDGLPF